MTSPFDVKPVHCLICHTRLAVQDVGSIFVMPLCPSACHVVCTEAPLNALDAESEGQPGPSSSTEVAARGAFVERRAKAKLALAAEHFNRDYKKGFQYLQVDCVHNHRLV